MKYKIRTELSKDAVIKKISELLLEKTDWQVTYPMKNSKSENSPL
jgi:hypothetical protein